MNFNRRRFSLDSSVSDGKDEEILGRRGYKTGKNRRLSQNLGDTQVKIQDLRRSCSLRSPSIDEEGLEPLDGCITKSSFAKHNKTFHKLFQEVPEVEDVTHTFTCALQKEVLYHGKLFVSENYVCFHSSVLLKDTKVVLLASNVREVKKQKSALSMLSIRSADGEKYSFASLRNREMCYKLLQSVCEQAQGESATNSPPESSVENGDDQETGSSSSSQEDGVDDGVSKPNGISLENGFVSRLNEDPVRYSTTPSGSITDEKDSDSWIRDITERVSAFLYLRRLSDLTFLFHFYIFLAVMLVLTSGYIALRITALEEQLNSLGALNEFALNQRGFQET